ncbi:MAG: hypothetical protein F6J90_35475 [Moorea sp. SIOASIH]|uniref:hypothetical protein n=1 Tax=Moorena sp. SIOASIH TaxID=2607817 RepID=UPI0013BC4C7B|nr:hypothetical protein [Moorena sp. SIOASIH]NEO41343.1 hypothetical protein [Moorena sp. SIOASIH]
MRSCSPINGCTPKNTAESKASKSRSSCEPILNDNVSIQPSAVSRQPSAVSRQPSAVSRQHSADVTKIKRMLTCFI